MVIRKDDFPLWEVHIKKPSVAVFQGSSQGFELSLQVFRSSFEIFLLETKFVCSSPGKIPADTWEPILAKTLLFCNKEEPTLLYCSQTYQIRTWVRNLQMFFCFFVYPSGLLFKSYCCLSLPDIMGNIPRPRRGIVGKKRSTRSKTTVRNIMFVFL